MRNKIMMFIILGIFLFSFTGVIAEEGSVLGTFKQGETIQLFQSCDSCSYVNLTSVKLPNSTIIFYNELMTKTGTAYNHSFSVTDLQGDYKYQVCGDKDGGLDCEVIDFYITINGNVVPSGMSIFLIGMIFLIFLTSVFFMYLSSTAGEDGIKLFFLLLSLIFLVASFTTGYMIATDSNVVSNINSTILGLVIILGAVLIIVFAYILIRQTINALDMFNIKRGREWNVGKGSSVGGYNTKRAF